MNNGWKRFVDWCVADERKKNCRPNGDEYFFDGLGEKRKELSRHYGPRYSHVDYIVGECATVTVYDDEVEE